MTPQLHYDIASLPDGRPCITVTGSTALGSDAAELFAVTRPYTAAHRAFVVDISGVRQVADAYLGLFLGVVIHHARDPPDPFTYLFSAITVRHRASQPMQDSLEHLIRLEEIPDPPH